MKNFPWPSWPDENGIRGNDQLKLVISPGKRKSSHQEANGNFEGKLSKFPSSIAPRGKREFF
jgi:hypothetical protein